MESLRIAKSTELNGYNQHDQDSYSDQANATNVMGK